ncbi:cystathionine gamma-synthase family protein [Phaeodactylibacter luteus]|uniref:Cystathionine gamma-synthase family protein n=1 Tax=Phaeodactylibacter luteus TaxID=1564516 RepID=A0A5C6RIY6_9BACT|nr:cystathionine gamma-synthase family protein [Phaeodactylibacter luteus]TXB62261.1 cystathionine gamma-synthase family protein [Phaeodactylibacter luteus]
MQQPPFKPESLMMSYGYKPEWSEGAIKCPIFQTSTFVFRSAEEGKAYFELAYGLREPNEGEAPGLIYSRLNNPDLEILENRLCLWDGAEECAVFESGMSAISTAMLAYLQPGDVLLYSSPVYGGTAHFITEVLTRFGIRIQAFRPGESTADILERARTEGWGDNLAMVHLETPANPTNALVDIAAMRRLADQLGEPGRRVRISVDNTYMGPLWQHPLKHGADLVLYSATKYIGGHSDVIAGACLGSREAMQPIKALRTFLGNMAGPWTGWLLMRSLETLKVRMEQQCRNAQEVATFLTGHPAVEEVSYLGLLTPEDGLQYRIYKAQCAAPGAMLSLRVRGGEQEAFAFLNALKLVKLAVSLGSTESLAQHPASMTHIGVPQEERLRIGITDNLVRLSVGVEHVNDLIWDLEQALNAVSRLQSVS